MNENPKVALDALINPSALTLGKLAILSQIKSPVLEGNVDDLTKTLTALYVFERPLEDVLQRRLELTESALKHYDQLDPNAYRARVGVMLDGVAKFFELLPRPEAEAKKN